MRRAIRWTDDARKHLKRLGGGTRERIRQALYRFAETGYGDVVKLREPETGLRLRVGNWRVRFDYDEETGTIDVHAVLARGEAYRRR